MKSKRSQWMWACVVSGLMVFPVWGQEKAAPDAPAKKIVQLEFKGPVQEVPPSSPFAFMSSKQMTTRSVLDRMKKMREDESVEAVFITFDSTGFGLGQLQDIRQGIEQLKKSGKKVYIYLDSCYSSGLYWLASSATELAIVPTGDVWLTGLYSEQLYVKNLLTNLHMDADFIHMGDYKSAGETLTNTEPSPAALEQLNWLVDDVYRQLLEQTAASRGKTPTEMEKLVNNGPYSAEEALKMGLIDQVMYRPDFVKHIKAKHGELPFDKKYGVEKGPNLDFTNPFAFFEFFAKLMEKPAEDDTPRIALIYVEGMIIPGEGEEGMFGEQSHGASSPLQKALYEAALDDQVKVVVLRVDSPGGSATASDIIWNATKAVAQKKPLIVSMGNVAGSGGYYVSCAGDTIFAEPGTITGSIGVVGGKIITKGFWEWAGVNWYPIKRGTHADMMATDKPFTEEGRAKLFNWMSDIYGVFKSRVMEKRKDRLTKPIDDLAGGRVYTGAQALKLGLVDKLGGLEDAIAFAAEKANLGTDYKIKVLPKPKTIFDVLQEEMGGDAENSNVRLAIQHSDRFGSMWSVLQGLEPQKAQALMRVLEQVQLFERENVLVVMPYEIVIH